MLIVPVVIYLTKYYLRRVSAGRVKVGIDTSTEQGPFGLEIRRKFSNSFIL
jgi:hypothetical protein